jgi:predicted permease
MNALRYSLRQLRHRPGFAAVVIVLLAVGIGATTAMFSVFYEIMFRDLPVAQPEALVNLGAPGPKQGTTTCTMAGDCEQIFSYPLFRDLEARQTVLSEIAGHYATFVNLAYRNQTQSNRALLVSGGYFPALRIRPALGRLLGPQDEPSVGESPVAVVSYDYWQGSLGGDPNVLGQTLVVNGQTLTIVGVAPRVFSGTTFGWKPAVFVPLTLRWLMESNVPRSDEDRLAHWIYAFGRLKPGVSLDQARASLNTLYSGIINEVEAPLNAGLSAELLQRFRARQLTVEPGTRGQSLVRTLSGPVFGLLLAVAGVVLLIVCFNVANLMLVRGAARAGEMAIRASIGASRMRLARELLLESATLATLGGLASIPVAAATLRGVSALVPAPLAGQVVLTLNAPAMVFAAVLSLGTVLLFGLLPALRSSVVQPGAALQGLGRSGGSGHNTARFGRSLTTVQITFSMLLLVFAGLFAQSLANLGRAELGMNVDSVVTFTVSPRRNGYSNAQGMQFFDALERDLAAQPGVTRVGSSMVPLLSFSNWDDNVTIAGREPTPGADSRSAMNQVSSEFFSTLSIPMLAGRAFTDADAAGAPLVAIVNQAFVRKFRLEDGALGKRLSLEKNALGDIEIVGVAADAKYSTVRDEVPPQFFLARRQNDNVGALSFYVRAAVPPDQLMTAVRRTVAAADPNLPVNDLARMDKVVDDNLFTERLIALLSGALAALATLLAATGLYGVLAYNVAQRTRELGLRLALGATASGLRAMVLKQVGKIALVGMPIGLAAGVGLGKLAKPLLFGLTEYEPLVLGLAAAALVAVVLVAGYLPARRASSVAPMEALRYE